MVHDEVHRSMDEFLNNMQRQGISPEMYYQLTGSTEEDLHKQFEGEAETRTKTNLVIEAIAKAENLEATEGRNQCRNPRNWLILTKCQSTKSNVY